MTAPPPFEFEAAISFLTRDLAHAPMETFRDVFRVRADLLRHGHKRGRPMLALRPFDAEIDTSREPRSEAQGAASIGASSSPISVTMALTHRQRICSRLRQSAASLHGVKKA